MIIERRKDGSELHFETMQEWFEWARSLPMPRYRGAQLGAIAAAYRWRMPWLSKRQARASVLGFQAARTDASVRGWLSTVERLHRRARRGRSCGRDS